MNENATGPFILVVDDEDDVVTYLCTVLGDAGYRTRGTTSGEEALRLAREDRPDLICLDISMPAPSGVRVYRELRGDAATASIPVVMVTGVQKEFEQFIKTRRQVAPPDGYIAKPFEPEELLETVGDLVAKATTTP